MAENVNPAIAEYNSFGPWAYEINDAYPMPPLFAPFFTAKDDAVLKIKVPRDVDRRNVKPGMDLYGVVLALYEDKLRILEGQEGQVKEHLITPKEFAGVRLYENMLKGGCTVFSQDGAVSFPFNSVSIDLFRKFADLVIEKLGGSDPAGRAASLPVTDSVPTTTLLINLLHDVKMKMPGIRIGAVQKIIEVYNVDTLQNSIERLLWKKMNPEALHLYTDKNLVILENGSFPNRVGMPDFGYTYTIIPLRCVDRIEIGGAKDYYNLGVCSLYLGPDKVTYHFEPDDNEEMLIFYSALKEK